MNEKYNIQFSCNEPKTRILESAAFLISQKGFAGTGVRDIAKCADVNISMISYYFGNKIGVLKAIIAEHYKHIQEIATSIGSKQLNKKEKTKEIIIQMVDLIRRKPYNSKVAIMEIPLDMPELNEYKTAIIKEHLQIMHRNMQDKHDKPIDPRLPSIVGPAFISMIYSNFLIAGNFQAVFNVEFDDDFYKMYIDVIYTLILDGVRGLKKYVEENECLNIKKEDSSESI